MTEAADAVAPACLVQADAQHVAVSGAWTVLHLEGVQAGVDTLASSADAGLAVDAQGLTALDSAGAWLLQSVLSRTRAQAGQGGDAPVPEGLDARQRTLLARVAQRMHATAGPNGPNGSAGTEAPAAADNALQAIGRASHAAGFQALAVLALLGELAVAVSGSLLHPGRWRWRQVLFNVRTSGVDALPIVGLLAFLLGIVVAYQSADQLQQFGANIFIVDVVGLSMLREFAPMMTAIIVAGRSGSTFAAQIGTMMVTEEIDAMRTLGLDPLELLVLPKLMALVVALPLLTFFADVTGVLGGMLMAHWQLGVGFEEFGDRFTKAVSVTAYLVGIGKAPVFAVIIVVIGCFQGLQTRGGADSVGRQTTRAVVQSTFLVIVADAVFSIAFSALDL
jgi:phospholipid/cholesterol/gamma-HCH transport system permease protein